MTFHDNKKMEQGQACEWLRYSEGDRPLTLCCSSPLTPRRGWGMSSLIIQKAFRPSLGHIVAPALQVAWFRGMIHERRDIHTGGKRRFTGDVNLDAFRMYMLFNQYSCIFLLFIMDHKCERQINLYIYVVTIFYQTQNSKNYYLKT